MPIAMLGQKCKNIMTMMKDDVKYPENAASQYETVVSEKYCS